MIEQKIKDYIFDYLSKPNFRFYNNMQPCPYAKKAWVEDKVDVLTVTPELFWESVTKECVKFNGSKDVIIVASEIHPCSLQELLGGTDALNYLFCNEGKDLWLLSSQDEWTMVLIQKLSKLDDAGLALEKQGYYNLYDKHAYNNFVLKRRFLREKYLTKPK